MSVPSFSPYVAERLGFYVYLLIHPATKQVFYVGKGTGNRIFSHINDALGSETESDKLSIIRQIRTGGGQVEHHILRHGLTEKEALEVESALIDFIGLPELSNLVAGKHAQLRGKMSVQDAIALYEAKAVNLQEPCILVIVNRLYRPAMTPEELYEITRGKWVLGERRNKARYALAVFRGVIRQVYRIHSWHPVNTGNPKQRIRDRWEFDGEIANNLTEYIGGSVEGYLKPGAQSPVLYINC